MTSDLLPASGRYHNRRPLDEMVDGINVPDSLFKEAEEEKIKAKYGLKELSAVERRRKRVCDHLENELKILKLKTQAIHFSSG